MQVNNWIMLARPHSALDGENGEKEQRRKDAVL